MEEIGSGLERWIFGVLDYSDGWCGGKIGFSPQQQLSQGEARDGVNGDTCIMEMV